MTEIFHALIQFAYGCVHKGLTDNESAIFPVNGVMVVRQWAIFWANDDQDLLLYDKSLGHKELTHWWPHLSQNTQTHPLMLF